MSDNDVTGVWFGPDGLPLKRWTSGWQPGGEGTPILNQHVLAPDQERFLRHLMGDSRPQSPVDEQSASH